MCIRDRVDSVPYRKETFAAQAPQSFYLKDIIAAHDKVRASANGYENMVDACTIIRNQGIEAHMVMGNRGNIKVTTPEDVYMFRALLQYKENEQAFGPVSYTHLDVYKRQIPEFPFRLKVKAGLTGYAQVYGQYNTCLLYTSRCV